VIERTILHALGYETFDFSKKSDDGTDAQQEVRQVARSA